MHHPIHDNIKVHAAGQKARLAGMLASSAMTRHLDPEAVIRVLDCLLNVPRERADEMMNVARDIAGCRRELQSGRWA